MGEGPRQEGDFLHLDNNNNNNAKDISTPIGSSLSTPADQNRGPLPGQCNGQAIDCEVPLAMDGFCGKSEKDENEVATERLAEGPSAGLHGAVPSEEVQTEPKSIRSTSNESSNEQQQAAASPTIQVHDGEHDHIETIAFHPGLQSLSGASGAPARAASGSAKESKLRRATRALLSLRRATSSLGSRPGSEASEPRISSSQSHRAFRYPKSLVASFWRQNTADNSTCTRSARLESFNSFGNLARSANSQACLSTGRTSSSQLDVSLPGLQRGRRLDSDQQSTSSSTFRFPQFIVPKTNALKLPIVCLIKSLDGELMREIFIHRYELGQHLIDNLKVSLNIKDAKYFGLKLAKSADEQEDVGQPWLDLSDSVYKQVSKYWKSVAVGSGGSSEPVSQTSSSNGTGTAASTATTTKSVDFYLRIKFYPPNLARVQDPFLKQYLWLQLRRDLRLGKLISSQNNLSFLMACVLQFEFADFKPELVGERLASLNVLPNQDLMEQQAIEIWRSRLGGAKRHQVQMQFLRASVILETYGFDYYPVRDHQRQRAYLLGFNYAGIKTIRNGRIVHHYSWHNLSKISYERRMIIFHVDPSEGSKRKQILGFKCLSNEECLNLYMRLQEQKYFFTVELTYFDKSLRRPSNLIESTWTELEQERQEEDQDQAQPTCTEGPAEAAAEAAQAAEVSRADNAARSRSPQRQPAELEGGARSAGGSRPPSGLAEVRAEGDVVARKQPAARNNQLPFQDCSCAGCRRELQMSRQSHSFNQSLDSSCSVQSASFASSPISAPAPAPASKLLKSCSLQEAAQAGAHCPSPMDDLCSSSAACPAYCASAPPNPIVHSNASSRAAFVRHSSVDCDDCSASALGAVVTARQPVAPNQARLQRQCPILKYSPEFEMVDETDTLETEAAAAATITTRGAPGQGELGERMAGWAERVLTQPARMLAANSPDHKRWSALNSQGQRAGAELPPAFGANLLLQGLLVCLLVLALNLALRLSDGIADGLQALFTFRTPPGELVGGRGRGRESAASCHQSAANWFRG